ncbi:hypothetical protein A8990_11184 [Paenibacillus taihuensis]|uniref:Uncharacterized protein n=1 Tax=Paenibacillus taihuensis TaxID=1156355 RepID=A0A3D9S167_9BACL|nr:hypothetical protein A8990_11184 [Paenibacillus taihuensis]
MLPEHVIIVLIWLVTVGLVVFAIPRNRIREAWVSLH